MPPASCGRRASSTRTDRSGGSSSRRPSTRGPRLRAEAVRSETCPLRPRSATNFTKEGRMDYRGRTHLIYVIVAPPDQVAEGDRIFANHAPWMKATHHRDGNKALLTYNVSKGPELSNPLDQNSAQTGNT